MTLPGSVIFSEPVRFTDPLWLGVGLAACLILLWLWRRYDRRQLAALAGFVSAHLRKELTQSISTGRRRFQRALYLIALALLFVALAGPEWGFHWENINRRGNEIVFALDTSRSMSTPDVKPNRLTRAKLAIDDFTKRLEGDAVGIVAFAGSAFLVCPITLDYAAFHESLSAIDTSTIPLGGTNITSAIEEAQTALRRRPGSDKILILVTDGEDLEGDALVAAQNAAREDSLKIYTVGVGTAAGDLIPLPPDQGGGFVKDDSGAFVKSHLDEAGLKAIAAATGGFYVPLGVQGEGLDTIFTSVLGSLAKHDLASRQQKIYIQRFQWPLAASLAILLSSLLIGSRRRLSARRPVASRSAIATAGSLTLLACLALPRAHAASPDAQPQVEYNAGTAAYRAGHFPQAEKAFQQSITHAPSSDPKRLADQEDAYYDLGNTLYRAGQKTAKSSVDETLKKWNDAVKAYETALQLRANDADSKYNRDLVKRKIEELKNQQNQNQQNKDNKKNPQQNQGQGKGQGQGQGQGQPPPQEAKNNDPKQGQGQQGQPGQPGQGQPSQPPPGSQEPQPQGQAPKNSGTPKAAGADPGPDAAQGDKEAEREADNQHAPGEMSREEARELLDSAKSDERHPMGAPLARREDDHQRRPPAKDW